MSADSRLEATIRSVNAQKDALSHFADSLMAISLVVVETNKSLTAMNPEYAKVLRERLQEVLNDPERQLNPRTRQLVESLMPREPGEQQPSPEDLRKRLYIVPDPESDDSQ